MRVDKNWGFLFLFVLCLGPALWAGERYLQEKAAAKDEKKSLIKKELLLRTKQKLSPPRRNIFSLRRTESGETRVLPNNPQPVQRKTPGITEEESSGLQMHIRYIGHIRSGKKIVALIILEDAALAVEKGEMISEGVQIGDITPEYIEVIGPDSVRKKYTLEGEKE
jgi:Tfp pilus assembly protein PilP